MKKCEKCGWPLKSLFAVAYKEWACFHCGATYEFFGVSELESTARNLKRLDAMTETKTKFCKTFPFKKEPDGSTKSINEATFEKFLKEMKKGGYAAGLHVNVRYI
jgi:hypothetical protein